MKTLKLDGGWIHGDFLYITNFMYDACETIIEVYAYVFITIQLTSRAIKLMNCLVDILQSWYDANTFKPTATVLVLSE